MPEGLLDYFDIIEVVQLDKELHIHLDEKNIAPSGYENSKLESKGFMPVTRIKDFPIRGQKVTLHIKRRLDSYAGRGSIYYGKLKGNYNKSARLIWQSEYITLIAL
ncbi:ISAon1 family transposase N-terminal region protein [Sphingobacterium spiritivorum]|uniref:ISAon1 family transposase N-terminal region protein n=1 Tax=Sphingobacterium spiritivorum TaxID=258 RepID=UPI003DA51D9D